MATYVMSDIHGQFEIWMKLLDKINFNEKTDTLILLGDYIDWGKNSMECLLKVMELNKQGHICLIGNHDLMLLEQLEIDKRQGIGFGKNEWLLENWEYNRGRETYYAFRKLPLEKRIEIYEWLKTLPYTCEYEINQKHYLFAHACPKIILNPTEEVFASTRYDSVWFRFRNYIPFPLSWLNSDNGFEIRPGEFKYYDFLIYGHTISEEINECGRRKIETHEFDENNIPHSFDIDCGGKCLGMKQYDGCRLACLELETFQSYYEY